MQIRRKKDKATSIVFSISAAFCKFIRSSHRLALEAPFEPPSAINLNPLQEET